MDFVAGITGAIVALSLLHEAPARASTPHGGRFDHITAAKGLTDQRVQAILQDRAGFMWFGTSNGLDRFDGYQIVAYRSDPANPFSLSGNVITALLEDHSGAFWVATRSGLNLFDPRTERFTRYLHDPADAHSLSDNTVSAILQDRDGVIWVGTFGGLNRFDPATGTFTRYLHDPGNPLSLGDNGVRVIREDSTGALWIGTLGGLDLMDRATATFTHHRHDPANPDSLSHDVVWDILEDRKGRLWLATDGGGVERFDRPTGRFIHHRHDAANPDSLSVDRVDCLFEHASGDIWVGTFGGGLSVLDPERGTFVNHRHDPRVATSLSGDYVGEIVAERSGLIWLAMQGTGVDVYTPEAQAFSLLQPTGESGESSSIWSIHETPDGELWLGTQAQGLVRVDRRTGAMTHLRGGHPWITAIGNGRDGAVWLGTYGGGLYRFDREGEVFTGFRNHPGDPTSLSHDSIHTIHLDRGGVLWIGTRGGGLNRLDAALGTFTIFRNDPTDPTTLSNDWIGAIAEDRDGKLWIGTRGGGLNLFEPATGKITRYQHDPSRPGSLADDNVFSLYIDRAGVLWVSLLGSGLDRFEAATGSFVHYRERDGLPSDRVIAVVEDGDGNNPQPGNLWISTGRGLARLDRDRKSVLAIDASDGLPASELNPGLIRSRTGEILIAGEEGLVSFKPESIRGDPLPPPVVFSSFQVNNRPVSVGGDSPLRQVINLTERLDLDYSARVISLEFAALSYRAPQHSRYRYMLEGFDSRWNEVGATRRLVTYTNLDPGSYLFRVTAANADGVWNQTGRALAIVITPPWWGRWWFRGLALSIVAGSALSVYLLRKRRNERHLAALEASEARYRGIVEDQPELVCRFRPDGTYTFVNGELCRYFGHRPEELVGKTIWEFVPVEHLAVTREFLASITVDNPVRTREYQVSTPSEESRWQQWTCRGFFDKNGNVLEYQGVGLDVTERVRAEEAQRQLMSQKVVESALRDEAKRTDEFLAMLGHELRNPLTPITLAAEVLRHAPPLDDQFEWTREVIPRQVKLMARLVDDLLDVSRISRGLISLRKETVDVRAVVHQAIETSRPLVDRGGQALFVSLPDAPAWVDGDNVRLAQVVSNLLNNAAKYSGPGAEIRLEVGRDATSDQTFIRVRDNGVGIPAGMLERVFERYTQIPETREQAQGGLGLGLTLVKRLVELHGGTVEAQSAGHGLGSEFTVLLPAVANGPRAAAASSQPTGPSASAAAAGRLRVLVVDDNIDVANGLAKLLDGWRHTPHVVNDGVAAIEAAQQFCPDVVLLDLGLPKLDGLSVARRLREEIRDVSLVLVAITGYGQPGDRRRTQEAGFDHHLVKPVLPSDLREILDKVQPR